MSADHTIWCRNLFALLKDGGYWAVPRSMLLFQKQGNVLVLQQGTMGGTDLANPNQRADYNSIKAHFAEAGITVEGGKL